VGNNFYSLEAVTSRIWHELEGGWIYDDSRFHREIVRDKVLTARADLLAEYFAKGGVIHPQHYSECCFDIECRNVCDSPIQEQTIPAPPIIGGLLAFRSIKYLGSADRRIPFEQRQSFQDVGGSYLLSGTPPKRPYFVHLQNRFHLYDVPAGMTTVRLVAIFANPLECNCSESDIFVPVDYLDKIEKKVKLDLSGFLLQRKIDKRNNAVPEN
jgi:hypothetical protein